MKRGLTITTKTVVYMMAAAVFVVCAVLLPELAREEAVGKVNPPSSTPLLISAWFLSLPIFVALYQTLLLIGYIDKNEAFSTKSQKSLNWIKACALTFATLILLGIIVVIIMVKGVDATEEITGIVTIGTAFVSVSLIIATFISVLQKLLKNAIDMKNENDLIV